MARKKSVEERLQDLEAFHTRVMLGQRWVLCALAAIGSVVGFISYLLSSVNQFEIWRHSH